MEPTPLVVPSVSATPAPSPPPAAVSSDLPDYAQPFAAANATDEDITAATKEMRRRAEVGEPIPPAASDALWKYFAAFRPSVRAKSISLVKGLHDAVIAVKAESYGPKAIAMLAKPLRDPKDMSEMLDEIQFHQLTAVQVIGAMHYHDGAVPLIETLLTFEKRDLAFSIRNVLADMPEASEAALILTLKGGDQTFNALLKAYPNNGGIPLLADALARISSARGRAAVIAALDAADNDDNRTLLAATLPAFPFDPALVAAFKRAYAKLGPSVSVAAMGGQNARASLLSAAARFHDATLVPWVLKEINAAKADDADQMMSMGFPTAIRLMTPTSSPSVGGAIKAKLQGPALEKEMYQKADAVVAHCKQDPVCYVKFLDSPLVGADIVARFGHYKAASMAAVYGNAATRDSLVQKLPNVSDGAIRAAMLEAILHLSPTGDRPSADAIEKLLAADKAAGKVAALDEMHVTAQRLRARVL